MGYAGSVDFGTGDIVAVTNPVVQQLEVLTGLGFATVAEMAAQVTAALLEGTKCYVLALKDSFSYDPSSTATPDGVTVVAAQGVGNWLRECEPSPDWAAQTTWYINTSTGSDLAAGTVGAPIKTGDEWLRRVGDIPIATTVTLNVTGDGFTFVGRRELNVIAGGLVLVDQVAAASFFTTTFTAVAGINRASNLANLVTASGIPTSWTASSLVGMRIRNTTHAMIAWVAKDMTAKQARTSAWINATQPFSDSGGFYTPTVPTNGDTFIVETLGTMTKLSLSVHVSGTAPGIVFRNFDLSSAVTSLRVSNVNTYYASAFFVGCKMPRMDGSFGRIAYIACGGALMIANEGSAWFYSCFASIVLGGNFAGATFIDGDTLLQGASLSLYASVFVGSLGIFDAATPVQVAATATMYFSDQVGGGERLYGSGNTGTGLSVQGRILCDTAIATVMTLTMASGTFANVGGVTKTLAQLPFANLTNGAVVARGAGQTWGKVSIDANGQVHLGDDADTTLVNLRINGASQTTVGAAGGATALPATPTGYIQVNIKGTNRVIPYYAVS